MFDHERYHELSALAMIGQLSAVEDQELNLHLRECASCRQIHGDYSHIIHKLPQADISRWRSRQAIPRPLPDPELRSRFFARARAEGVHFTVAAEQAPTRKPAAWNWGPRTAPVLACAATLILALWGVSTAHKFLTAPRAPAVPPVSSASAKVSAADEARAKLLQDELSHLRDTVNQQMQEIQRLSSEKDRSQSAFAALEANLAKSKERESQLVAQLQHDTSETEQLQSALQQKDAALANLKAANDDFDKRRADNLSEMAIQETRIQDLTRSLEQERENLERERQLMAVSQDVRQLMGARNLHIIDVRDVNASSTSDKAFGRVFYAEGQSMVFYAFDLPNGTPSPARYTFQAWGQREGGARSLRSLGVFEVDSREQHRWVLKVNDPTLVAGIDSVFVTAESIKDNKEPHGKKLLYAYLAGQPNHP